MDFWNDFISALRRAPYSMLFETIDFVRAAEISMRMEACPLQDPHRFRACFLGRRIAEALVDESGNLLLDRARQLRDELGSGLYWVGPRLEEDFWIMDHIHRALGQLVEDGAIQKKLRSFSPPVCHRPAEQLIRLTLWPNPIQRIGPAHLLTAVLAAWFTRLRQITGSCFATAPAIVIQREQPLQFLDDLQNLMTRGRLRRVIEGKEFAVPLSPSTIHSDLLRPLIQVKDRAILSYAPGLIAAFSVAQFFPAGASLEEKTERLQEAIEAMDPAGTPKQLIEELMLRHFGIEAKDLEDEAGAQKLQMSALLSKQSAVYYQKESPRAKKVADWKKQVAEGFFAYQALADCALLRAWESTVASFCDVKLEFGRWNLFVSLGIDHKHSSGIGGFLYRQIDERLQQTNRKIEVLQREYEDSARAAQSLETMFHRSVDEAQRHQLKAEWTSFMYVLNNRKTELEELSAQSEQLAHLFSYMLQSYDRKIQESFQEIFDPSLAQLPSEMIDDSPAGFRLAYKHGNFDAALWTYISNQEMFIQILCEFFSAVEKEMIGEKPAQEKLISQFSTELIQYIQTPEFIQGAIDRASVNTAIQKGYKKPWEYISGGTMETLLTAYFQRIKPFTAIGMKVESPMELLHFLIECRNSAGKGSPLFIHSPTHAFLFEPDAMPLDVGRCIDAMKEFWERQELSEEEGEALVERFSHWFAPDERPLFIHRQRQLGYEGRLGHIRDQLIDGRSERIDAVDGFLFESIPLISADDCAVLAASFVNRADFLSARLWTPVEFREKVKREMIEHLRQPLIAVDIDGEIAKKLRAENRIAPAPIFFGDTNWSAGRFALAISPNGALSIWRVSRTGMSGAPMERWFQNQKGGTWICYTQPTEYGYWQ